MFNLHRTNNNPWDFQKDISGCGLSGLINKDGKRVSGEVIIKSIKTQHDRGNGLGGGFAAYGIYPDFKDHYAVHVMCETKEALNEFENFLKDVTIIDQQERIPTRAGTAITNAPLLMRYFVKPNTEIDNPLFDKGMSDDDFMVRMVMKDVNIAATMALQALSPTGRELGLRAGANIIMPNVTDLAYRRGYQLYQNKPGLDENAVEQRINLEQSIEALGEKVCYGEWGDSLHFKKRQKG